MKTENLPIKLECFAFIKSNANGEFDKVVIGTILIPLRSVPVLPKSKALQMKPRWYRLTGLASEWRQSKPELLLYIMITDKSYLISGINLLAEKDPVNYLKY